MDWHRTKDKNNNLPSHIKKRVSALQEASKLIDTNITKDSQFPELWDFFNSGASADYIYDVKSKKGLSLPKALLDQYEGRPTKSLPLPKVLLEQYEGVECTCFMGIFPEINRVWITIDNQLFLWNYEDESDFSVYDGLDQIIVSVALVSPKEDIFVEDIKYLLVISTPVEIVLLAVCFENNSVFGELSLHPTQLALPTDNVNMLKIVGSDDGRIFMGGKDGCLYEIEYHAEEGWFRKKCRKINHSMSYMSMLVPSFLKFGSDDGVIDLKVDSERMILYTLSRQGTLIAYDLGQSGKDAPNRVGYIKDVVTQAQTMSSRMKDQKGNKSTRVLGIEVIPISESRNIHLVAITSSAVRMYFSTTLTNSMESIYDSSKRPSTLEMIHVRLPPDSAPLYFQYSNSSAMNLSQPNFLSNYQRAQGSMQSHVYDLDTVYYSQGLFMMADSGSDGATDNLITVYPDVNEGLSRQTNMGTGVMFRGFFEKATMSQVKGKVWYISEVPFSVALKTKKTRTTAFDQGPQKKRQKTSSKTKKKSLDKYLEGISLRDELVAQHFLPPRQFLCLTSESLHFLTKTTPLQYLVMVLIHSQGGDSNELAQFFDQYGVEESCAMCLILAASSPSATGLGWSTTLKNSSADVRAWASRVFMDYGRRSSVARQQMVAQGNQMGVMQPEEQFSSAHNAFSLYLSRILMSVWNDKLSNPCLGGGRKNLSRIERKLLDLQNFLVKESFAVIPQEMRDDYLMVRDGVAGISSRRSGSPFGDKGNTIRGSNNIFSRLHSFIERTKRMEEVSLANLHLLLERCLEMLSFFGIISQYTFQSIIDKLPQPVQTRLKAIKFCELVGTAQGFELTRMLILALVNLYTSTKGPSASVERICSTLRERCPSIFRKEDHIRCIAEEHLLSARAAGNPKAMLAHLDDSLKYFMSIAAHIVGSIEDICDEYQFLRYYSGVVSLVISATEQIDPSDLALSYHNDPNRGNVEGSGFYEFQLKQKCYSCVVKVLEELFPQATIAPVSFPSIPIDEQKHRPGMNELSEIERGKDPIQLLFRSTDKLLHVEMYNWFMSYGLKSQLLEICIKYDSPFLEDYLKDISELELLSSYYITLYKFPEAAQCLEKLAFRNPYHGRDHPRKLLFADSMDTPQERGKIPTLEKRVNKYLAKAVSCAKSCRAQGKILQDLNEKMEVAQIQLGIFNALSVMPIPPGDDVLLKEVKRATDELQGELYSISDLYNKYARRFGLWESCLDIVRVSGHTDPSLVKKLWTDIYETAAETGGDISSLAKKIIKVGQRMYPNELVFPVEWLCNFLEHKSFNNRETFPKGWVVQVMREIGVSYAMLADIYHYFHVSKDSDWNNPLMDSASNTHLMQIHITQVLLYLITKWKEFIYSHGLNQVEVSQFFASDILDRLGQYITFLASSTLPDAQEVHSHFTKLRQELRRNVMI